MPCVDAVTLVCLRLYAWPSGWLHPSINLHTPEAGVDLVRVVAGAKQHHPIK